MGGEKKKLTIKALQQRTENAVQEEERAETTTKGDTFLLGLGIKLASELPGSQGEKKEIAIPSIIIQKKDVYQLGREKKTCYEILNII